MRFFSRRGGVCTSDCSALSLLCASMVLFLPCPRLSLRTPNFLCAPPPTPLPANGAGELQRIFQQGWRLVHRRDACVPGIFNRRGRLRTSGIKHKFSCKPVCAGLQLKWLGLENLLTDHVEGLAIAHDEDLSIADDLGEVGLNFGIADSSMQLRLCCN